MMEIEKKFALADIKTVYNEQKLRTLACNIVKYQLFRANKAVHKMESHLSKTTTIAYFKAGVKYIREGIQKPRINQNLFRLIDECIRQHVQPLTPSKSERAIIHKKHAARSKHIKTIDLDLPQQVTESFIYGIRKGNNIVILPDEQSVVSFIKINRSLNDADDVTGVMLTIEEMKNV